MAVVFMETAVVRDSAVVLLKEAHGKRSLSVIYRYLNFATFSKKLLADFTL
jgi:hypothetical protein